MEYCITNGILTARVSSRGAELKSLAYHGTEYIWPGGAEWGWSAPVCCPWCGALDAFDFGGAQYPAGRHGFVREREHTLALNSPDALAFTLGVAEGDERWPWPFELVAEYTLCGASLTLTYTLTNTGAQPMPLQFGFHPGFLAPEGSLIRASKAVIPDGSDTLRLAPGVFDNDSIHLDHPECASFCLERGDGRSVTVDTDGYEHVLLWGAPGETPFACIEPWTGYPGPGGPFEREGAISLSPGAEFKRTLKISLN